MRRRWKVAAVILVAAGLVTVAGLLVMVGALYGVAIDLLEIVSLPHDV